MKPTKIEKLDTLYKHHYGKSIDEAYADIKPKEATTHEVGNWYGGKNGKGCVYMTKDGETNFEGYGITLLGGWGINDVPWRKDLINIKLTPQEAHERLSKWFMDKGYNPGVRVWCAWQNKIKTISKYKLCENSLTEGNFIARVPDDSGGLYVWLMHEGELARIVEEPEKLTEQEWLMKFKENGFELYKAKEIERKLSVLEDVIELIKNK